MKLALFEADGRDIKVRAISDQIYLTGIEKSDFVDVFLKKLSGNTSAQKQSLAQSIFDGASATWAAMLLFNG